MSATFTTSDGINLSFERHGGGPEVPVLLVMGFAVPGKAWRFIVPHLGQGRSIVWYDHRGTGASDAPRHRERPYSMARLAADAIELMDHLGWSQAHVVGVSMGGMVSQHIALTYPARVRTLTLMATHAGGFVNRVPTAKGVVHFARALLGRGPGRWQALSALLFPKAFRDHVGEQWVQDVLAEDLTPGPKPAGRFGQLSAVFGHDTRKRLAELAATPTLIVSPSLDLLVRPRCSTALHAGIPGSQLMRIPDAGHGLIRQAGDVIGARIREHFAQAELA